MAQKKKIEIFFTLIILFITGFILGSIEPRRPSLFYQKTLEDNLFDIAFIAVVILYITIFAHTIRYIVFEYELSKRKEIEHEISKIGKRIID